MSGEAGYLDREEFIEYARKSGSIRDLTDRISSGGKSVGPSVNKPKVSLDKAELAFKVSSAEILLLLLRMILAGDRQGQLGLHRLQ